MRIDISPYLYLDEFTENDQPTLIQLLDNEAIAEPTLLIPSPYTEGVAKVFVDSCAASKKALNGTVLNWAIRDTEGVLLGGISRFAMLGLDGHRDELVYWVGQPYWGRGIASEVLRVYSDLLLSETRLQRLEAYVFEKNEGSMRVLEKAGFEKEGFLKKYYVKNGVFKNVYVYAKVK